MRIAVALAFVTLPVLAVVAPLLTARASDAVRIDPPALDSPAASDNREIAVLAGGCFWGIQAIYQHVKGVHNAVSGYAGGTKETATYQAVAYGGRTDHAESVEVTFDPRVISFGKILQILFSVGHDPTQLDRQGPDVGRHYRSEIFAQSDTQRKVARAYVAQLDAAKTFASPIVTKIGDGKAVFYPAEDYHQDYALKNPHQPYIIIHDAPKVENLKRLFPELYRAEPTTVAMAKKMGG
jgi:peptide-methionine (S)-S-oxide reductase